MLLMPQLVLEGKADELVSKLEEVRSSKTCFCVA